MIIELTTQQATCKYWGQFQMGTLEFSIVLHMLHQRVCAMMHTPVLDGRAKSFHLSSNAGQCLPNDKPFCTHLNTQCCSIDNTLQESAMGPNQQQQPACATVASNNGTSSFSDALYLSTLKYVCSNSQSHFVKVNAALWLAMQLGHL